MPVPLRSLSPPLSPPAAAAHLPPPPLPAEPAHAPQQKHHYHTSEQSVMIGAWELGLCDLSPATATAVQSVACDFDDMAAALAAERALSARLQRDLADRDRALAAAERALSELRASEKSASAALRKQHDDSVRQLRRQADEAAAAARAAESRAAAADRRLSTSARDKVKRAEAERELRRAREEITELTAALAEHKKEAETGGAVAARELQNMRARLEERTGALNVAQSELDVLREAIKTCVQREQNAACAREEAAKERVQSLTMTAEREAELMAQIRTLTDTAGERAAAERNSPAGAGATAESDASSLHTPSVNGSAARQSRTAAASRHVETASPAPPSPAAPLVPYTGLTLSSSFDKSSSRAVCVVRDVAAGSPAAEAGILPADIVSACLGEAVRNTEDFVKQATKCCGSGVLLSVQRGGIHWDAKLRTRRRVSPESLNPSLQQYRRLAAPNEMRGGGGASSTRLRGPANLPRPQPPPPPPPPPPP